jgi:hypothetical protein
VGRLGVVSLPAVAVGVGLDGRVVRRHVARLEAVGWLGRAAGVWGEGSVVWLTARGLAGVGLGGVRPVKAPPSPTTIAHGVLVCWSAARVERRGHCWLAGRELALEPERWAVRMRDERGLRWRLPDLAVWPHGSSLPVAVIGDTGQRRADRQRQILEGWRHAIRLGQYAAIRYDCAGEQAAQRISRLANELGLTAPVFVAVAQSTPEQIAAIMPDRPPDEPDLEPPLPSVAALEQIATIMPDRPPDEPGLEPPLPSVDDDQREASEHALELLTPPAAPEPEPQPPEPPQAAGERERIYRQIMGLSEPKRRHRWRHRQP